MAEGFLGRWAQRKQAVREGKPVEEPAVQPSPQPSPASGRGSETAVSGPARAEVPPPLPAGEGRDEGVAQSAPPTLADVQSLGPQSDFTRFVAPDVDPEVRNEAMKKLFADPHFNVMDRMDVYIDDYNTPDPMPASMLRQLASAKFLKLFDEEEKKDNTRPGVVHQIASAPPTASPQIQPVPVAQASPPAPIEEDHDHTDLRLQQDHAAGPQGSGRGPQ